MPKYGEINKLMKDLRSATTDGARRKVIKAVRKDYPVIAANLETAMNKERQKEQSGAIRKQGQKDKVGTFRNRLRKPLVGYLITFVLAGGIEAKAAVTEKGANAVHFKAADIWLGNKTSNMEVYFIGDWYCGFCRRLEPAI